ncbi:MAG TPA: YqiA/YcfP family alpha/beta fold hydrolase [Halioglobus sp.]
MNNLIIHVHGFLSASEAERVSALRKYIHAKGLYVDVISPQLPETPKAAIDAIEKIIADENSNRDSISLIGHSLGGYFSTYIASKNQIKAVLVNPVVRGYEIMCEYFGECYNPHTDKKFNIGADDIAYLISINVENIPDRNLFMVMQQLGDEIIDPNDTLSFYNGCKLITVDGGCHDFSNFENHIESVVEFLYGSHA